MINVVVDSSVAIKWFVVEPHSDEARTILNGYKSGEINLLAPDLVMLQVEMDFSSCLLSYKLGLIQGGVHVEETEVS